LAYPEARWGVHSLGLGAARERLYKLYESKAYAEPRTVARKTVSLAEKHGVPVKYAPSKVAEIVREIRAKE